MNMMVTKIFFPMCSVKELFFRGYVCESDKKTIIYLTDSSSTARNVTETKRSPNSLLCYYGDLIPKKIHTLPNHLIIQGNMEIKLLTINNKIKEVDNILLLIYNYNTFRDSQILTDSSDDFTSLQTFINQENGIIHTKYKDPVKNVSKPYWLISSMFLQHVYNYINLMKWIFTVLRSEKKSSIKLGNLILAIASDIILGYIMLYFVTHNTKDTSLQIMDLLEKLINMLNSLLLWLMGAPAGLKLNNAFNKMLGKYFSYHVQLWWQFLDMCSKKLDVILNLYQFIGYLGLTFQIAIISDLIFIATFHSYCIYVYAARLFNIQISGLVALLRLFVGRKYNPLRGSIDSCEYTNQELFVGTVAFTILLLLLPTTALYYIVFTVFRLMYLSLQHILAKVIYIVQTLPLYVTMLWIVRSPKVAGDISIKAEHKDNSTPLIIVTLRSKPISKLIDIFKPPVVEPKQVEWSNIVSNILMGKQII